MRRQRQHRDLQRQPAHDRDRKPRHAETLRAQRKVGQNQHPAGQIDRCGRAKTAICLQNAL